MTDLRQIIYPGMCYLIPLAKLRETPKVRFHFVPGLAEEGIATIQRVKHEPGALSPSIEGNETVQPWYMHPHQEDNCMVLHGERVIDLYTAEHGLKRFEATPEKLTHAGEVLIDVPHIIGWYTHVFHRPNSPQGSTSIFITRHFDGFDFETEFNIYELNIETGEHKVLRAGKEDQRQLAE